MPDWPYSIELHDSAISAILNNGGMVTVKLFHAYVHRDGKGWSQKVDLVIEDATISCDQTSFPAKIRDGYLKTKKGSYHNLLYLPFDVEGKVKLKLEFFSGAVAEAIGNSLRVVLNGEPVFVENVSGL